jgi:cell cycle arrest protein BUB3
MNNNVQYSLNDPPEDGITKVLFGQKQKIKDILLVTSWDGNVRLYDTDKNSLLRKIDMESPILDCCFVNDTHYFTSGVDKKITMFLFFFNL